LRGHRCDLCVLTHRMSSGLITRICELITRVQSQPSFTRNKQSVSMASGSLLRGRGLGAQRPFTAGLPGFFKDVRTEVMPY
jgi:hypothetical protein